MRIMKKGPLWLLGAHGSSFKKFKVLLLGFALGLFSPLSYSLDVPDWPGLYDPLTLLELHVVMTPENFNTIVNDELFDIEVPALFWAEDEPPILVSIRRKSATKIGADKVSFKIDINEYTEENDFGEDICDPSFNHGFPGPPPTCNETWHGVKKLSLENGDDVNVVTEGVAWYLHRIASEYIAMEGKNYNPGLASWINFNVNGVSKGVYVNVEQHDKQFFKNHLLWEGSDNTWAYKYGDILDPELDESPEDANGDPIDNPTFLALCFLPFDTQCSKPGDFEEKIQNLINLDSLLTSGAVSAFHYSPDDLLSKGKNFFIVDYTPETSRKREYLQWDLDSAFGNLDPTKSIYNICKGKNCDYEKEIINNATFRGQYNEIMQALLDGPFNETDLLTAINDIESTIRPALELDPNRRDGLEAFDKLRSYFVVRRSNVQAQLPVPPIPPTAGTSHVGDLDGTAQSLAKGAWGASVSILIDDYMHAPVHGAHVQGTWSDGLDDSCITENGLCSVGRISLSKKIKKINFTVNEVNFDGLDYDSSFNHDPDGDSNGTTIKVSKP